MTHPALQLPDPTVERELFALVRRERLARDLGEFDLLADLYWPDAVVRVTWFTGSIAEFIEVSRARAAGGRGSGFHVLSPIRAEVAGDRAVVESRGQIHIRPRIDGVECDVVSWGRFFSRLERRDGQWRLLSFDSIYTKDRMDPVDPAVTFHLDQNRLAAARPSYRHLTYLNRDANYLVPDDLPGDDRPDLVRVFYTDAWEWMHASGADARAVTPERVPGRGNRGGDRPGQRGGRGVQLVFQVDRTERVGANMVRVHLGGPAFETFLTNADPVRLATTDKYVKLLVAKPELGLVPPYDLDALRAQLPAEDVPVRRTYTVRSVNREARTIALDFVVHGTEGIAGPWAAAAQPGDLLALSGPGGQYEPDGEATKFRLLIGDESALPAIGAALEALPANSIGMALLEVGAPGDEVPLTHPAGVDLRWVYRHPQDDTAAGYGELLVEALQAVDRPTLPVDVFVHGERSAMKEIGRHLADKWGLDRRAMSLSAYWALGRAEDRFQAEKREPVGQLFVD